MRRVLITLTVLATAICGGGVAPGGTPDLSPVLQVLGYFMGSWDEAVTSKPTARSVSEAKMSVVTHRKWVPGGKIARAVGT